MSTGFWFAAILGSVAGFPAGYLFRAATHREVKR